MCLCCTRQHKWSTEAADAVVLAPLSPGPHVHAGGCFFVWWIPDVVCYHWTFYLSPVEVLNAWQPLYSDSKMSPTPFCLLSGWKHMSLYLNMAPGPWQSFSTAWFMITSSRNGDALWWDGTCVGIVCSLDCAGSCFVFIGKWPELIILNNTGCVGHVWCMFLCEKKKGRDRRGGREKLEEKKKEMELLAALFLRSLDSQGNWLKSY